MLVVALGADYDLDATPGLVEHGNEFYSVAGAEQLREVLPSFTSGTAIVGVCGAPFKCPPAPSEAAILLDEFLRARGVRDDVHIQVVIPFGAPLPPSPETSTAILARFAERGIEFMPEHTVARPRVGRRRARRREPSSLRPVPRDPGAPGARRGGGVGHDGGGLDPRRAGTLATRFPNVYAVGDVTSVGTREGRRVRREAPPAWWPSNSSRALRGEPEPPGYDGTGTCYIEFGDRRVGRVDVDFFSTPGHAKGTFTEPSAATTAEKADFATSRRARWFG